MTEAQLKLREQVIKKEELEKVSDICNEYIELIRNDTVARLSGHLSADEINEYHAMLICLLKLQQQFKVDIMAGKIAEKELMINE